MADELIKDDIFRAIIGLAHGMQTAAELADLDLSKTWADCTSVDDLVRASEKRIIPEIEAKQTTRCPYLRKLGEFFYYCSGGIPEDTKLEFSPFNPIAKAKSDIYSLQLWCMAKFENCCCYKGELPFPGNNSKEVN